MAETTPQDGFSVREMESHEEVHFVACARNGDLRERTMMGLMRNMDLDNFYVVDTRDEENRNG